MDFYRCSQQRCRCVLGIAFWPSASARAEFVRAVILLPRVLATESYLRGFVVTLIAFLAGNWVQREIEL